MPQNGQNCDLYKNTFKQFEFLFIFSLTFIFIFYMLHPVAGLKNGFFICGF